MDITKSTYIIDLTQDFNDINKNISKSLRRNINYSKNKLLPFTNRGMLQVFTIQNKEYKYISMIGVKIKDKETISLNGMCNNELYNIYDGYALLIKEAIIWAKEKGFKKFDLGGVALNPTKQQIKINNFKKRFGGESIIRKEPCNLIKLIKWRFKKYFKK